MLYKRFQAVAQIVGTVTIGLLAVYGLLAVFNGGTPVWAAIGQPRAASLASQDIPATFNYQGLLRNPDGSLTTGSYTITARVYTTMIGSSDIYHETFPNVTVRDGLFNVVLGDDPQGQDLQSAFSATLRYIGISLNNDPELIPRQRLHAVPWALYATHAMTATTLVPGAKVNGLTVTDNLTVTGRSNLGPHFIDSGDFADSTSAVAWTTYTPSIPSDATAVILEARAAMSGPDSGDTLAHIRIRADETSPVYVLLAGRAAGDGDVISWASQGIFPVNSDGTFQYTVEAPGFGGGWAIRVVGYYR